MKEVAEFLLGNMAFFFIPAGVNIINSYDLVVPHLLEIVIVCVVSTIITFFATAFTVKLVMKVLNK